MAKLTDYVHYVPAKPDITETAEVFENASGVTLLSPMRAGLSLSVWNAMPRPAGRFLTIRRRAAAAQSKGGIIMPDMTKDDAGYAINVGQVLAIGPDAFRHEDFMVVRKATDGVYRRELAAPRCKVGDWILFMRQEQLSVTVYEGGAQATEDTQDIRFIPDRAVLAQAPNPDQLRFGVV